MWAVLVLIWISSTSLSESQVPSPDPLATTGTIGPRTSGNITLVTSSHVTLTEATSLANSNSTEVIAETANRTRVGTSTAAGGTAGHVASGTPAMAISAVPTSASQPAPLPSPGLSSLSTPHAQVPSSSMLPRMVTLATSAPSAATTAAVTPDAGSPGNMHSSSEHTANGSPADTAPTMGPQILNTSAQASNTPVSLGRPEVTTASRATPTLSPTTQEPTALPSVASVSTTAVTTSSAQAGEPIASTAPAPHASPTPAWAATSQATPTQSNPALPTQAAEGPGTPRTPEQLGTEVIPGTASSRLTPGSSGGPKMQATDSCQPSTQGHHLVVTAKPLPQFWVNRSVLLVVLLLGVTLLITVLVLFALQAYESYKKKDYTQVDYLINGMYADSEM